MTSIPVADAGRGGEGEHLAERLVGLGELHLGRGALSVFGSEQLDR